MGQLEQQFLAPAEQGRNQQVGEIEIVERLRGKGDRREQILYRQRLLQVQAVDAGDRHALLEQAGDDQ